MTQMIMDGALRYSTQNISMDDVDVIIKKILSDESIPLTSQQEVLLNEALAETNEDEIICCLANALAYSDSSNQLPFDLVWSEEADILALTPNNDNLYISICDGEYLNLDLELDKQDTSKEALKDFIKFLEECNLGHLYDEMDWLIVGSY